MPDVNDLKSDLRRQEEKLVKAEKYLALTVARTDKRRAIVERLKAKLASVPAPAKAEKKVTAKPTKQDVAETAAPAVAAKKTLIKKSGK